VKLLLDEMWPAEIAAQLRRRQYDVVAVCERPDLRGQSDAVIFAAAQAEGRAIVTENAGDFRPLASFQVEHGSSHAGLILTSNHRFPRNDPRTIGRLVSALIGLLSDVGELVNAEHWLT
jgi:predicted nuclease of predicted toxin-antitoxin system